MGGCIMSITGLRNESLIVILYDQAVKLLKNAVTDLDVGFHDGFVRNVDKTEDIIEELNAVLNMDAAGDIAKNLRGVYNLMLQQLNQAKSNKDPQLLQNVIAQMQELNETWRIVLS